MIENPDASLETDPLAWDKWPMVASEAPWEHDPVPIVTFRRPAANEPSSPQSPVDRELAYALLVPCLAVLNLILGLAVLVLARHAEGWKAGVLLICGALICGLGGWLGGVTWLRAYWRSRMERQMRLWTGVVDTVTGWEEEVGVSSEAALKLKRRLDRLMAKV